MSDESPSKPPVSDDPNSLANLLPEYFDDYPSPPPPGPTIPPATPGALPPVRKAGVKTKTRKDNFNYMMLGIVAIVGLLIVPLLIFGVFVVIANLQPAQTTINVSAASTPLVTVYSITPGQANSTPAPAAKGTATANPSTASANGTASGACPAHTAFGQVIYYSCARTVQAGGAFSGYFSLTEVQLAQDGQNGPAAHRYFAVTTASPAQVLSFYASLLPAQGYSPAGADANGTTPLGDYAAALYSRNGQQLQILAVTVNKASPDGQVNPGQTLIRLSSS